MSGLPGLPVGSCSVQVPSESTSAGVLALEELELDDVLELELDTLEELELDTLDELELDTLDEELELEEPLLMVSNE